MASVSLNGNKNSYMAMEGDCITEPIAIVGLSCRFAGDASTTKGFWQMMADGRNAWSEPPSSRWNINGAYHHDKTRIGTTNVKGAYFLRQDPGLFDAAFFGYSGSLAAAVDPQYRLQLESAYEALENAGQTLKEIAGSKTSCYMAVMTHDYHDGLMRDGDNLPRFLAIGTTSAVSANRISHFFDLRGTSLTLDTGCSGGLVALHQAVLGLRAREANMAIVGGCNLMLSPDPFKAFSALGMLSPEGVSYAFDSRANGYGRGEGVGTIVLKRLGDALKAGDPIRAVIRESLLNQDGKTDTITQPLESAQIQLMRECYTRAGIDPSTTQYFEAHGTGTPTGDPIEARAIANVFGTHSRTQGRESPLVVGSVKTNIGHTEAASGLAAVIKLVLAMERNELPPSINYEKPNPGIRFEDWGLEIATKLQRWPAAEGETRRASINNFGFGGTNSHVIIEGASRFLDESLQAKRDTLTGANRTAIERRENNNTQDETKAEVLVFYGRDEQSCQRMILGIKSYLDEQCMLPGIDLAELMRDLSFTLGSRRTRFDPGWVAVYSVSFCQSDPGLASKSLDSQSLHLKPVRLESKTPRIGLVFTGQGAQWHAMARELISSYRIFRATLDEAQGYLFELGARWSLVEELMRDEITTRVNTTGLGIPICVAVQIALVRLLRSWGIEATAVTSHSSGEIAASYAVGALSFRQAMVAGYYRAFLATERGPMSEAGISRGAMAALGVAREAAERDYLTKVIPDDGKALVACVNSPNSVTIAGDERAVQQVVDTARENGVFARHLKVDMAYHSHHMIPLAEPYRKALDDLRETPHQRKLETIFSSPVTGGRITHSNQLVAPDHLVRSLIQPVEFVSAFTDMVLGSVDKTDPSRRNVDVVIEVGPHTALGGPIREILAMSTFKHLDHLPYMGCLKRGENARNSMLSLAAGLIRTGYPVELSQLALDDQEFARPRILTDLPPYPWNHNIRHWAEPRTHTAYLQRNQAPHDLLGMPVPGTNPDRATWSRKVRISDHQWLQDHVIQGAVLWPGAGFVSLAVEAMKQHISATRQSSMQPTPVAGFRLRQVEIDQALVVPDDSNGIEMQTVLCSVSEKIIGARGWKEFQVLSVTSGGRWTQHAKGLIMADSTATLPGQDCNVPSPVSDAGFIRRINPEAMWTGLHRLGLCHGPTFQNIQSIVQDGSVRDNANLAVTVFSVANCVVNASALTEFLLHPTTLDSVFISGYAACPEAGAKDEAAKVPRSIKSLWVSAAMPKAPGHILTCHTSLLNANRQTMEASIKVVHGCESGPSVLEVDGLVYQSLGRSMKLTNRPGQQALDLATRIEWHVDLMASQVLQHDVIKAVKAGYIPRGLPPFNPKEREITILLQRVCTYFCHDAVQKLADVALVTSRPHSANFYQFMMRVLDLAASSRIAPDSHTWISDTESLKDSNMALARTQSVDGEMICRLGPLLGPMLLGQSTPFTVMAEDDGLLSKYLAHAHQPAQGFAQFVTLLRAIFHKNPRTQVLQIGAGIGEITHYMLEALGADCDGGPFVQSWHLTDTDPTVLEAARAKFAAHSRFLDLRANLFDVERDPRSQGFQLQSYDIIVASDSLGLFRTKHSMVQVLENVGRLMKPGAQLLFMQQTQEQVDVQFIQGLIFPQRCTPHACISLDAWGQALKVAGFDDIDIALHDHEAGQYLCSASVMRSTVRGHSVQNWEQGEVVVVTSSRSPPPVDWLDDLSASIASCIPCEDTVLPLVQTIESPERESVFKDKICVFIGEVDQPLLINPDAGIWDAIRRMVTTCRALLWVTRGGAVECANPSMALATGFARVLRNEYVGRKFITLDLDPEQDAWCESNTTVVSQIVSRHLLVAKTHVDNASSLPMVAKADESELAHRHGLLLVPRIYKDARKNGIIHRDEARQDWATLHNNIPDAPLEQPGRPLRVHVGMPGMLDSLAFDDDVSYDEFADDNTIEIEPRAYGVNFRDIMVAMDQLQERVMGMEVAGIISRLGSNAAAHGFAIGDRVFGFLRGPFASRARMGWHGIAHVPQALSFEEAASLPMAFGTAYECLVNIARVRPGQSILIHSAAGGVGQAAITLAKDYLRCEVYATCSSQEKREFLMRTYGLPREHIFDSRNISFASSILTATNGRGVDVVLNSLSGSLLQASFNVLAPFGHMVEIGKRDIEGGSLLDMAPFAQGVSYSSVDMIRTFELRHMECHRLIKEVARLVEQGFVKPVRPLTVYPISDICKGFRLLQTGKHIGKVVLSIAPNQQVRVVPRGVKPKLKNDAAYLIVGGIGGIGRSVAFWMASYGAKNIIVFSRSAGSAHNHGFVSGLKALGCRAVALDCDVSSKDDLSRALRICKDQGMPPVRGVVHGAMVLKDSIVENMSIDDWNAALGPKVTATWNLHSHFSQPGTLDFFIMLSSLSAIFGWPSQSNYAAGGAYEDAVARFRVARGLPAVSLDLGVVVNVGNDALTVTDQLAKSGQSWTLTDRMVMQALGAAILDPFDQPQVLYGLNPDAGPHWDPANSPMGREALFLPLRYRDLVARTGGQDDEQNSSSGDRTKPLSAQLQGIGSLAEVEQVLGAAIASKLAEIFMISVEDIDMTQPPASFGVDSLVAVELRNMLMMRAAADMPIFTILQSTSILALAGDVAAKSSYVNPEVRVAS